MTAVIERTVKTARDRRYDAAAAFIEEVEANGRFAYPAENVTMAETFKAETLAHIERNCRRVINDDPSYLHDLKLQIGRYEQACQELADTLGGFDLLMARLAYADRVKVAEHLPVGHELRVRWGA